MIFLEILYNLVTREHRAGLRKDIGDSCTYFLSVLKKKGNRTGLLSDGGRSCMIKTASLYTYVDQGETGKRLKYKEKSF